MSKGDTMTDNETTTKPVKAPRTWKTLGTYKTYEDADLVRNQLLTTSSEGTLVKVKRCGPEGTNFKVKQYIPAKLNKKNKKSN